VMVSTRSSDSTIEDVNALTLRSRIIKNTPLASHEHAEHATPQSGQRISSALETSIDDERSSSVEEDTRFTVMRSKETTEENSATTPTRTDVSSSTSLVEERRLESTDASKQLEINATPSNFQPSPEVAGIAHGLHKRLEDKDSESDITKVSDSTILVAEDGSMKHQANADNTADDASDDEGAPETFRTNVKPNLPFAPTFREPKTRRPKMKTSMPLDDVQGDPTSISTLQDENVVGDADDQPSSPTSDGLPKSKRHRDISQTTSKRAKDITKDGITYRTISSEDFRGQTSQWLPARANAESRRLKERMLVRRRIQEVNIGQRPKFAISR
jgi:hypothetical protein